MSSAFETIRLDIADGVASLTLNRPERLNSFNDRMHQEHWPGSGRQGPPAARACWC